MNKKILITCIIAICILIGVSFTSVVGYRSVASEVKASPLFNIRSSRAIDEESEGLSCEYVGRGEDGLSIPKRDGRILLIHKITSEISEMDDTTFDRFLDLVINRLELEGTFDDEKINGLISFLEQIRNEPIIPVNYRIFHNIGYKNKLNTDGFNRVYASAFPSYCRTLCLPKFSIIYIILFWPLFPIFLILEIIARIIESMFYHTWEKPDCGRLFTNCWCDF